MRIEGNAKMMKLGIVFLVVLFITGCGGGNKNEVDQFELYGKKRVDCTQTKSTDEAGNITQCAGIRPDDKEIEDTNNLIEEYSPDDYNTIY